eukprot:gene39471-48775_t
MGGGYVNGGVALTSSACQVTADADITTSRSYVFYTLDAGSTKMVFVNFDIVGSQVQITAVSSGSVTGDQTSNCVSVIAAWDASYNSFLATCQACAGYGVFNIQIYYNNVFDPTVAPSGAPFATFTPSVAPSQMPSAGPSIAPSWRPSVAPSAPQPTVQPTLSTAYPISSYLTTSATVVSGLVVSSLSEVWITDVVIGGSSVGGTKNADQICQLSLTASSASYIVGLSQDPVAKMVLITLTRAGDGQVSIAALNAATINVDSDLTDDYILQYTPFDCPSYLLYWGSGSPVTLATSVNEADFGIASLTLHQQVYSPSFAPSAAPTPEPSVPPSASPSTALPTSAPTAVYTHALYVSATTQTSFAIVTNNLNYITVGTSRMGGNQINSGSSLLKITAGSVGTKTGDNSASCTAINTAWASKTASTLAACQSCAGY